MIRPFNTFNYSLGAARELLSAQSQDFNEITFTGITQKDSQVLPGDLFVGVPGAKVHGAQYIETAVKHGAVAILTDEAGAKHSQGLPTLIVKDVREAAAMLATSFYRSPIRDMESIAITGTNGKTTVTTLLHQIFEAVGRDSGLIGTVETRIGADIIKSERTTPEAIELQAIAATMRERHMRHCVMEVSSHALELKRMIGSHFAIAGFTNLSQDHLDYHKDMESYFAAKAKLFTHEYSDLAFINIDDSYGLRLAQSVAIPVITLSRQSENATWHFTNFNHVSRGSDFALRGKDGLLIESTTQLRGGFNLDNLLLAIAIAYECGVDPLELATIIPILTGAAGRLESINLGQNFSALVDYAHSPDAVKNVLAAIREFTSGKLIAVLGCGGDRDSSKRPLMGAALAEGSDIAIFTSDNPRSEAPQEILHQMVAGMHVLKPSQVIEDRAEAIEYAVSLAEAGDTVVILGKGHEVGQEINGEIYQFDDRHQLARAVEAKR